MIMHGVTSFLIAAAAALSPNSAIVVGGSSGMGKAAAAQFVKCGGRTLLVSRDADKLQRAREEILHATGADASAVDTAAVDAADELRRHDEVVKSLQDFSHQGELQKVRARAAAAVLQPHSSVPRSAQSSEMI